MEALHDPDALGVEAAHPALMRLPSFRATGPVGLSKQERNDAIARSCGVQLREVLRHVFERKLLPMVSADTCDCCNARRPMIRRDWPEHSEPDESVDMRDDTLHHEPQCSYVVARLLLDKLGAL